MKHLGERQTLVSGGNLGSMGRSRSRSRSRSWSWRLGSILHGLHGSVDLRRDATHLEARGPARPGRAGADVPDMPHRRGGAGDDDGGVLLDLVEVAVKDGGVGGFVLALDGGARVHLTGTGLHQLLPGAVEGLGEARGAEGGALRVDELGEEPGAEAGVALEDGGHGKEGLV